MGLVGKETWEKNEKMREAFLRRLRIVIATGKKRYVRYKIFIDGKHVNTITIKDHGYAEFSEPFYQKYPQYKPLKAELFDHCLLEIRFKTQ